MTVDHVVSSSTRREDKPYPPASRLQVFQATRAIKNLALEVASELPYEVVIALAAQQERYEQAQLAFNTVKNEVRHETRKVIGHLFARV